MTENIYAIHDQVQVSKEEPDILMPKKLHSNFKVWVHAAKVAIPGAL